jgi:serine/threonine-protein kinase
LGEGGFGRVFEAWDQNLSRKVAIKVARKSDESERLLREAKAAASLTGAHIVSVFDVGHLEDGSPYLVMEYLQGHSIGDLLLQRGRIDISDVLRWSHQICQGLEEAHRAGFIHRDVKPSNLFIVRDARERETVKLLDFGLARSFAPDDVGVTQSGVQVGSPAYMSPEQVRNQTMDQRTDIWSVGVVMYRMLSGKYPFAHDGTAAMLVSIVSDPPQPLERQVPGVPQTLVRVVERCLAKSAAHRYSTVRELDEDLCEVAREMGADWSLVPDSGERALRSSSVNEVSETIASPREWERPLRTGRRRWYAAAVISVVGVIAWLAFRSPEAPTPLNQVSASPGPSEPGAATLQGDMPVQPQRHSADAPEPPVDGSDESSVTQDLHDSSQDPKEPRSASPLVAPAPPRQRNGSPAARTSPVPPPAPPPAKDVLPDGEPRLILDPDF